MTKDKTRNKRQSSFRQKRIAAGFDRKDFWIHPEDLLELRALEKELFQKRLNELEKEGVVICTGRGGFTIGDCS